MVLRSVRLLVTDPKPVLCKKSPDYPLRQTVIIEAVEAISPLIKDPKLELKLAALEIEKVRISHPKYIMGISAETRVAKRKLIKPTKTSNMQIKYNKNRHL